MKKILTVLLALTLLFGIFGCTAETEIQNPVQFYYPRVFDPEKQDLSYFSADPASIIGVEIRDASFNHGNPEFLINSYLKGPMDPNLVSLFPDQCTLVSMNQTKKAVHLILSPQLSKLSGVELSLACSCLAKTCLAYFAGDGVETVRISTAGYLTGGYQWLDFSKNDILLVDDSVDRLRNSLILYLTDDRCKNLLEVPVTINLTSGNSTCNELMNLLLNPQRKDLYSPIPEGTISLGVTIDNGICAVNLSGEFMNHISADSTAQYLALQSITNTLTQLGYVTGVNFYCEGSKLLRYGTQDTSHPWIWDDRCVITSPLPESSRFAALCLPTEKDDRLIPLVISLEHQEATTSVEQLLQTLVHYKPLNGYRNPIPAGTKILRVEESNGVYSIHVSKEFLSDSDNLDVAIRTIVASVFSLPKIAGVKIVVTGQGSENFESYFSTMVPSSNWYA